MRVLVTGHKGFIGRNVFLDWQETLGYVNVDGIDHPEDIEDFRGGDYDLVFIWLLMQTLEKVLLNLKNIMKIMQ